MKKLITLSMVTLSLLSTGNLAYANTIPMSTNASNTVVASETVSQFNEIVINSIKSRKTVVDISKCKLSPEDALNRYFALKNCEPEIWYASSGASVTKKNGKAYTLQLNYSYTEKEVLEMQIFIDNQIDKVVEITSRFQTDYEKAKAVYDFLIDNYDYDFTYSKFTEYELLSTGTGVCSAYSLAYKDILTKIGIPCKVIVSKEISHQWNAIQLDGEWYEVDVAWGDIYSTSNSKYSNFAKSTFFMELLGHTGGVAEDEIKCTNRKYDLEIKEDK